MAKANIKAIIESVVDDQFPGGEVESIRIRPDTDFEGEPILAIDLIISDTGEALDSKRAISLARHLRSKLAEVGETRFPLLSFISKADAGKLRPEAA